ncbi:hypothetical protein HHI36_015467, partial [Cryptolaemus montrouzieri]
SDAVTYEVSTVYHPQPRILSQPDVIKIISPSNAVVADMPIVKCKSKPHAADLAAVSHVPLLTYENNEVAGMNKIKVEEIDDN